MKDPFRNWQKSRGYIITHLLPAEGDRYFFLWWMSRGFYWGGKKHYRNLAREDQNKDRLPVQHLSFKFDFARGSTHSLDYDSAHRSSCSCKCLIPKQENFSIQEVLVWGSNTLTAAALCLCRTPANEDGFIGMCVTSGFETVWFSSQYATR